MVDIRDEGRRIVDSLHRPGALSSADRLSALRDRTDAAGAGGLSLRRKDLLIGATVVLAGVALVFALMMNKPVSVTTSGEIQSESETQVNTSRELLANEAFIPLSVEIGHFPPQLEVGHIVEIAVTPGIDGTGEARILQEEATVVDLSTPNEVSTSTIITVRAAKKMLIAIARSGPLFVSHIGDSK